MANPKDRTRNESGEQPSFEQAIEQLEAIIDRIESGEIGLERSIAEYERGVALIRRCRQVLESAEQRVEELQRQTGAEQGRGAADAADEA